MAESTIGATTGVTVATTTDTPITDVVRGILGDFQQPVDAAGRPSAVRSQEVGTSPRWRSVPLASGAMIGMVALLQFGIAGGLGIYAAASPVVDPARIPMWGCFALAEPLVVGSVLILVGTFQSFNPLPDETVSYSKERSPSRPGSAARRLVIDPVRRDRRHGPVSFRETGRFFSARGEAGWELGLRIHSRMECRSERASARCETCRGKTATRGKYSVVCPDTGSLAHPLLPLIAVTRGFARASDGEMS